MVCTKPYHTPLERPMNTQTLQSHWFIVCANTCGLMELLTLLTAAEVKEGFNKPAKQQLAAHLRRVGWPEPWHTIRGAHTPNSVTHSHWPIHLAWLHHQYSVLYGRLVMHHLAYINILWPIVSLPKSVLLEPYRKDLQWCLPHWKVGCWPK